MPYWYQIDTSQVLENLQSDADFGLSDEESRRRLLHYGANELVEKPPKHPWQILWEQLTATTVLVLIVAAVISAFLGDYQDATAIVAIFLLRLPSPFGAGTGNRERLTVKKLAPKIGFKAPKFIYEKYKKIF